MAAVEQGDVLSSFSESDIEGDNNKPIIFDSEDSSSVLSHAKTPMPQIRSNPAIFLQECLSCLESADCQDMLKRSVTVSRKFSTEGCENYRYSTEKVKRLVEQLANLVRKGMPAHAAEQVIDWKKTTPEVLLIHGILHAGNGDYKSAIEKYRQTLVLLDMINKEDTTTKHLRINSLNHIGVTLCLINNFDEAERYFQFALEGYATDHQFLSDIITKYSEMAVSAGPQFVKNSPIAKFLQEWHSNKGLVEEGAQASSGDQTDAYEMEKGPDNGEKSETSWFPVSKEELLDYSAAYIQMSMMGIEMEHHTWTDKYNRGESVV